jgi:uncharacterized protein YndB with AHSA1/START domain
VDERCREQRASRSPSGHLLRAGAQVYQVFIKASPEQIWEATMKPEFTQEYSYGCVDSTFQPGSPYLGWSEDRCEQFVEGEVLEADPPRRLSHTWRTLWDTEAAAEQKA